MSYKIAQLLTLAGRTDLALEQLGLVVDQGFFCPRCIESESAFDRLRQDPELRRIVERASARHRAFALRFELVEEPLTSAAASS